MNGRSLGALKSFKYQCKELKEALSSAPTDQRTSSSAEFYLSLSFTSDPGTGGA